MENFETIDPDRHLKRLTKLVGISHRIQALALKKRRSIRTETKEERIAKILVSFAVLLSQL